MNTKNEAHQLIGKIKQLSKEEKEICTKAIKEGQWSTEPENPLRKVLNYITTPEDKTLTVDQQLNLIKVIGLIEVSPEPFEWETGSGLYKLNINCIAYAVGLANSESYRCLAKSAAFYFPNNPNLFTSTLFASYLIGNLLKSLEIKDIDNYTEECLLFYIGSDGKPKHAGIYKDGIVKSVWGTFDGIFTHQIWHVPENYGNKIMFFKRLPLETMVDYFMDFLQLDADGNNLYYRVFRDS